MLVSTVTQIVAFCTRFSWFVIGVAVCIAAASAAYTATHFAINTDINKLISPDLDWRQREQAFETQFPGHFNSTLVVIDAPTPELVAAASSALLQRLQHQPKFFQSVQDLSGSPFFARNGLMFQPTADVAQLTQGLEQMSPFVGALVGDPSLRGLTRLLSMGLGGVQQGMAKLDDLARPLSMAADTLDSVLAGRPAVFSWQELLSGKRPSTSALRRFIDVQPVLDFAALEPGRASCRTPRRPISATGRGCWTTSS